MRNKTGLPWFLVSVLAVLVAVETVSAEEPKLADQDIADAIEDQYLVDRTLDVNGISVRVQQGIAELTGGVDNLLAKERAGRIAGMVKGVRSVNNRIQVVPSSILSDIEVEDEVESALRSDPAADAHEIDVSVHDGVVALKGEVQSFAEMELVSKIAKSVRGVMGLDNRIELEFPAQRADAELRGEIEQRLRSNVLIDDGLVEVSVKKGVVIVKGVVGSLEEKRLAESLARVVGVRSVDASGLEVHWWADEDSLRNSKYAWKPDEDIRQAIKDAALYDPRLLSFRVEPDVSEGWVTLRGEVDNLEAKRAAGRVARNTVGVTGVTNRLKVRPRSDLSEEMVVAAIRTRLTVNPVTETDDITVTVDGGTAILEGTVASYLERMEAERLASKATGVTRVRNRLSVDYEIASREPYYGSDFPTMSAIIDRMPPGRTDREIHDEIHEELVWSPFVDAEQVDIDVQNGQVTLTGTVETWREYYAAEENAYEGGALTVSNELEVK